jgi:general secretion pathway protein C
MHALVTRWLDLVLLLAVATCVLFAAKLVNHAVAGDLLADAAHGPTIVRAAPAPDATPARGPKDAQAVVDRNMFCTECAPPVVEPGPAPPPADPSIVPLTALPLRLVATHVAEGRHAARDSLAFVVDTASDRQGAYAVGARLASAGPIVAIAHQHVDFHNEATGRDERIALLADGAPRVTPPSPPKPDGAAADLGIRATGLGSYDVDRSLLEQAFANPMAFARDARLVPSTGKDGRADGFRVVSVRSGSAAAALGLTRGDTIQAINGISLDSMDAVMNAFGKLRDSRDLQLDLMRGGKPTSLRYSIR